jgi:hypothetical protein
LQPRGRLLLRSLGIVEHGTHAKELVAAPS